MKQQLIDRYGAAVPRYTSYPTAPHFHSGITPKTYETWLQALPASSSLSLYLHVPFCQRMCWYCGCHTKITRRYEPISEYAKHLALEIGLVGDTLNNRQTVQHIHWGGGTPTILSADDFSVLMVRLRTQFRIAHNAEIAIEIDPCTMTRDLAVNLAKSGVNRASLGVQDFNSHVQKAINRSQTLEQTKAVVGWLRDAGIAHINLDLMYGLPNQSVADAVRTAEQSLSLRADRYSVFGYAHVPWMKKHQRRINETDLPSAAERMAQSQAIAKHLLGNGYSGVGLDHFARPNDAMSQALKAGKLHRNFQGYTTDSASALIGFGVSAIGRLPQGYVQNTSSARLYMTAITDGKLPTARGIALSAKDNLRRQIIERLMCDLSADLPDLCAQSATAIDQFAAELQHLKTMEADGLVSLNKGVICITHAGQPFVRSICAVFDQFLDSGKGHHSLAV